MEHVRQGELTNKRMWNYYHDKRQESGALLYLNSKSKEVFISTLLFNKGEKNNHNYIMQINIKI